MSMVRKLRDFSKDYSADNGSQALTQLALVSVLCLSGSELSAAQ